MGDDPDRDPVGAARRCASCVYRGFCKFGCSTNAKQSALVTWIPRAIRAGAEIRDLAMVGRIEIGSDGRTSGVHYHREGRWRYQRGKTWSWPAMRLKRRGCC